ncbi:MAG: Ig-like domain-containing protein [Flavobacteriales bacterium]|nr:Ig-like domain-containing protein [Flavobacteriales bacterium]
MKKILLLCLPVMLLISGSNAQTTVISSGSLWKYLDDGSDQGTSWTSTSFNDASWSSGYAELGYGDGDETTVVSYGSRSNRKYITTYFRKAFTVNNPSTYTDFNLQVKRDDGIIVYLNGSEVYRNNMPSGSVGFKTNASGDASDDGNTWFSSTLNKSGFVSGTNYLAVEIHQSNRSSSDISFDLQLTASGNDVTAPLISSLNPSDNSTGVSISNDLTLTFNENVKKGSGNILIKESGTTVQTIDVASGSVSIIGSVVTINPQDLSYSESVNIEFASGVFLDLANNAFAGISSSTDWNFSTEDAPEPDNTAPVITQLLPADDATNVLINSDLVITFDEDIKKGTGNILVKESGTTVQTIPINSSDVSINGSVMTINTADFSFGASENIEMPLGIVTDLSDNDFAGITNSNTWNFTTQSSPPPTQTIIAAGSLWKYLDNGSNQGTTWRNTTFNDGSWKSGYAELGYGDGDETTVVSYGSNSKKKYITTYFRKSINIGNISIFADFDLRVKRDDGIVVYVNGVERYRDNMPTGSISYTTKALTEVSDDGNTWFTTNLPASYFTTGTNVIAVEIHQRSGSSSDISFDLELIGNTGDLDPPVVSSFSPADNSTDVLINSNLSITFNEAIQKGTGNILIKEGGSVTQTISVNSGSVTVSGNTLNINPSDFSFSASVNVEMASGVVLDLNNNSFAGISGSGVWNFITEAAPPPDTTAPSVVLLSPEDNSTGVLISSNLSIMFDEAIQKGTGSILIKENGSLTQTIDVNSSAVIVSGATLSIDPADFTFGTVVNIEMASGVVKDGNNNSFSGISGSTVWNFTIESAPPPDTIPPSVSQLLPADDATGVAIGADLELSFSEDVKKGSGNILIKEGGSVVQTIAVTSSDVSISGSVVSIATSNYSYSANVNVEIPSGVFLDLADNAFQGITTSTGWNFSVQSQPIGNQTLITEGDSWKYLDNGSNQGTAWRGTSFNDASWASGNAQLGYGDGDETTVVSYGSNSSSKYITTYFRKTISVADVSSFSSYSLRLKRDDGIVVYINGNEVYRSNLGTGTVSYNTLASNASDDGNTWQTATLSSGSLTAGTNVIAAEIHQTSASSSDISFDLELVGKVPGSTTLTRGPYLQMGTSSSVVIRWRSADATNTRVSYGTSASNLNNTVSDNTSTTEHEIQLSNLTPNTVYYYSIGSTSQTLQGDAANYFKTAPLIGSKDKTRIWVVGDCGNNSTNQVNVLNRYESYIGNNITDVWLLLGDNAYSNGLDNEFQDKFFNIYKNKMMKQAYLWPAPGNHDYAQSSTLQNTHNMPYYDMFTLPTNGQIGGVASGTEAFYSYNHANIHFLSLDSYGKESNQYRLYDTLGPQVQWIKQDLAADTSRWKIAYWHHPPYTMGSHNSDSESELINIRQNFIRILERYKVDLILCGHSHDYERSKLMKGHYGNESSFNASTHHLSSSSAKYDGSSNSCPYHKSSANNYDGTVYVVSGSAGQLGGTQASFPHNSMYFSDATNGGSMSIEIEDNRLDAKWICADGNIRDRFTMVKDVSKTTNLTISSAQSTNLTASWVGNYNWNTGSKTSKTITVSPTVDTTYVVTDGSGCITDVFNITISAPMQKRTNSKVLVNKHGEEYGNGGPNLKIYPNPFNNQTTLEYSVPNDGMVNIEIYDLKGVRVHQFSEQVATGTQKYLFNADDLKITEGIYLVKMYFEDYQMLQKISILKN